LNLIDGMSSEYEPTTGTANPLRFACERGTCPQGGVESCYVFLAVMD
jgi:hypothetical protein